MSGARTAHELTDAELDGLVTLVKDAARGGCGVHEGCRALVAKHQRDAARRWLIDYDTGRVSAADGMIQR